jgi:hypothetical protein
LYTSLLAHIFANNFTISEVECQPIFILNMTTINHDSINYKFLVQFSYRLQRSEETFGQILDRKDFAESHRPMALRRRTQLILPQEILSLLVVDVLVCTLYRLFAFVQHIAVTTEFLRNKKNEKTVYEVITMIQHRHIPKLDIKYPKKL